MTKVKTNMNKSRPGKKQRLGRLTLAVAASAILASSVVVLKLPAQTESAPPPQTAAAPAPNSAPEAAPALNPGEVDYFSRYLIDNANNAIQRQRYDQAIDFVNRALENHPQNIEFLLLAADVEEQLGNWAGAESRLSQILTQNPGDTRARARRGLAQWYLDQMPGAEEDLALALKDGLSDNRLRARTESALAEVRAGRKPPRTGGEGVRKSGGRDEDWAMVALMEEKGDWAWLERFYTRLLEESPNEASFAFVSRGFARLSLGKTELAAEDFKTALTRPDLEAQTRKVVQETLAQMEAGRRNAAAWESRQAAISLMEARSDWAGLDRFYTEELNKDPGAIGIVTARGFVRLNLGRLDEGEKDLLQALEHPETDAPTKELIRRTLDGLEAGRAESQKWAERQAVEARLQKNRDWEGLEKFYTEIIEEYPGNSFALSSRGFARLNIGRHQEAKADFTAALAHDDLDPQTRKAIEETMAAIDSNLEKSREWDEMSATMERLERKKDWPALERYYTEILAEKPQYKILALTKRGYVRLAQGRLDAAEADFLEALAQNPDTQTKSGLRAGLAEIKKIRASGGPAPGGPAAAEPEFDPDAPAVSPGARREGGRAWRSSTAKAGGHGYYAPGYTDPWPHFKTMQGHLMARRFEELAKEVDLLSSLNLQGEERGHLAYFEGELLWHGQKPDEAYLYYAQAESLVQEKYRRSDVLWRLSEYSRLKGQRLQAADYARQSAALIPNEYWRLNVAGFMMASLGHDDEALDYFQRSLKLSEPNRQEVGLYYQTANTYNRLGDKDSYKDYLRLYIDRATDFYQDQPDVERHEAEELFAARRQHSYLTRNWGLDSYIFGADYDNDDYSIQMVNELYGNIRLENSILQPYAQLNGSLASRYSGTYYEPWLNRDQKWMGHSHLRESMYGIVGLRFYPFPQTSHSLSVGLEQVIKIGTQTEHDTRLRLNHFWHTGLDIEAYVPNWLYITVLNQATYSTRNNDLTAFGESRLGRSFRLDLIDDRLVLTPHLSGSWGYGGENVDKGQRWSLEAGPGLSLRKWYREDRYNAPMSSSDITVQYRWGLSHERHDALLITLSNSF